MTLMRRIVAVTWPIALLVSFVATFRRVPSQLTAAVETVDCTRGTSVATLERCVALDPTNVELLSAAGAAREANGDWPEAEAMYRRALAIDPRDSALHVRLGELLLRGGDRDGARAEAQLALRWHPNNGRAMALAARVDTGPAR